MNENIKNGVSMVADGLKEETKDFIDDIKDGDFKKEALETLGKISDKLKAIADKVSDDDFPEEAKSEINELIDKIQDKSVAIKNQLEAKKMEAEIAKEKMDAEIKHSEEIKKLKDEVM